MDYNQRTVKNLKALVYERSIEVSVRNPYKANLIELLEVKLYKNSKYFTYISCFQKYDEEERRQRLKRKAPVPSKKSEVC